MKNSSLAQSSIVATVKGLFIRKREAVRREKRSPGPIHPISPFTYGLISTTKKTWYKDFIWVVRYSWLIFKNSKNSIDTHTHTRKYAFASTHVSVFFL